MINIENLKKEKYKLVPRPYSANLSVFSQKEQLRKYISSLDGKEQH